MFSRCKLNNNETNILEQDVKPADHFLLYIQDEPIINKPSSSASSSTSSVSSPNVITNNSKKPSPPPPPRTSSSPAYSDISDEESTPNEQILPPSTINLLTATNGKLDDNGKTLHSSSSSYLPPNGSLNNSDISNPAWTAQMIFQQFGPFMQQPQQQQTLVSDISTKTQSPTPNRFVD